MANVIRTPKGSDLDPLDLMPFGLGMVSRKMLGEAIEQYSRTTGRKVSAAQAKERLLSEASKLTKKGGGISKAVSEAEKKYAKEQAAKRSAAAKKGAETRKTNKGVRNLKETFKEQGSKVYGSKSRLPEKPRTTTQRVELRPSYLDPAGTGTKNITRDVKPNVSQGKYLSDLPNMQRTLSPRSSVAPTVNRKLPPGTGRALAVGGGLLGGGMLFGGDAMQPPSLPSQGQIDQAQGVVNSDEYKRTQQIASTPNAPSQSQIDKAQGIVNSPQYGQTLDIASGTTPATDTTTATATKADDDNKGGVVNWMKRLAPLIAGIGGTGIAAAIGGKDAALGYAQGFSGEYMKGQERNRQQAELERKEKRLDLKEATARMDDLLIAGAIAPAQAIFESMADQYSEEEKRKWGDVFKEAQRLKDEGKTDAMFIKRMEAFQISGVLAQNGQIEPAVEAYNKYLPEDKHITSDDMEEFRRGRMWENVYQDQVANNMSHKEATIIANTAVDKLLNGYVTYKQARLNAKLKNDVIEASNNKDEKNLNKISLNTDVPADIREEADKALAKINEDRQGQGQSGVNMTEEMFKPIGFGLRGLPSLPIGLLNTAIKSGSGAYKGVTGQ